jgi:hypothetical protein
MRCSGELTNMSGGWGMQIIVRTRTGGLQFSADVITDGFECWASADLMRWDRMPCAQHYTTVVPGLSTSRGRGRAPRYTYAEPKQQKVGYIRAWPFDVEQRMTLYNLKHEVVVESVKPLFAMEDLIRVVDCNGEELLRFVALPAVVERRGGVKKYVSRYWMDDANGKHLAQTAFTSSFASGHLELLAPQDPQKTKALHTLLQASSEHSKLFPMLPV